MSKHTLIAGLAMAALLGGCDQAFGPDAELGPTELRELSDALIQDGLAETADTSTAGTLADGLALDQITSSTDFTRVHDCPSGGQVVMSGTRSRTRDTDTRTGTMDVSATRTFTDCARPLSDSLTVTLNGAVTFTAHREWESGAWHGMQEVNLAGGVDWTTDDGRAGTCQIDVQAGFDPGTHNRTVTGTACGEDVGDLQGWTFGTMGQNPGHHQGSHNGMGENGTGPTG